jgi:hypothetical protein
VNGSHERLKTASVVILIRTVQQNTAVPYGALAIALTVLCTLLRQQLSLSFLFTAVITRLMAAVKLLSKQ